MTTERDLIRRMADALDNASILLTSAPAQPGSVAAEARAYLATHEPAAEHEPDVDDVLCLAAIIRKVDGSHSLGAAALAEAILSHPGSRWQPTPESAAGPSDEDLAELAELFNGDPVPAMRRALELWGHRPKPIPLSDRLPGPEDCDAEGKYWCSAYCYGYVTEPKGRFVWTLSRIIDENADCDPSKPLSTHWLPYHALPLPEQP